MRSWSMCQHRKKRWQVTEFIKSNSTFTEVQECVKHLLPLLFFCYLKRPHFFRKEKKKVLSIKYPCLNALRRQAQIHVRFTRLAVLVNSETKQKVDETATHKRHPKCFPLQFAITESKPLEAFLCQRMGSTPWWRSTAVQAGITRPFIRNADHITCFSEYTCWNSLLRLTDTAIICLSNLSVFFTATASSIHRAWHLHTSTLYNSPWWKNKTPLPRFISQVALLLIWYHKSEV